MLIVILGVLFFSSSLAKVLTDLLISKLGINFFSSQFSLSIPSFSSQLGLTKTFDVLNFGLQISFALLLFGLYVFFSKNKKHSVGVLDIGYLSFSILLFLQTHFVRYSGREVLMFAFLIQALYVLAKTKGWDFGFSSWIVTANGFLSGFYTMLIIRQLTTSILWIAGTIIFFVIIYHVISAKKGWKFIFNPFHLLFIAGVFFPWNRILLLSLEVLVIVILAYKRVPRFLEKNASLIYSLAFVFLLAYDPLFYYGNLDSVEEGFWLAWVQRLITGQILYKDVAVYHPPIIIWGLGLFVKLFGRSVYETRLYFHILKVVGLIIIFLTLRKLLKTRLNVIMSTILILSFVTGFVRNNIEIRVAIGLFSLYLLSNFFEKKKFIWLLVAGLVVGISFGISIEAGIAATVASIISILVSYAGIKFTIKRLAVWFLGVTLSLSAILGILASQKALGLAIKQITFYARAFSAGYFNVGVPRPDLQNSLQWWRVDRYLSSGDAAIWEIGTWFLIVPILYLLYDILRGLKSAVSSSKRGWHMSVQFISRLKVGSFLEYSYKRRSGVLSFSEKFAGALTIYSLILARVALGRSDWYHLVFMLTIAVIVMVYTFESIEKEKQIKYLSALFWIVIVLVFTRSLMQEFLNRQIFKIESYANISQTYKQYKTERSKIALDIDAPVTETDGLVDFLTQNTNRSEKIFTYPWNPELYFLADRNNATSFDTPYAFFTREYQEDMIRELKENKPKYVIFNPDMNFAGMSVGSLPLAQAYINNNYKVITEFGKNKVMINR